MSAIDLWNSYFKSRVNENNGCLEFAGARCPAGYGRVGYKNKVWQSHRLSYLLYYGEFDKALFVCHRCDNPPCINPEHLFLGTSRDNVDDMLAKGRSQKCRGESHSQSRLTEKDVLSIRMDRRPLGVIAVQYGVAEAFISTIKSKRVWSHLEGESIMVGYANGERQGSAVLNEDQVRAIRLDRRTNKEIGKEYGVVPQTIRRIKLRETWKHI